MSISGMRSSKLKSNNRRTEQKQQQEELFFNDEQFSNSEKVYILLTENADKLLMPFLEEQDQSKLAQGKKTISMNMCSRHFWAPLNFINWCFAPLLVNSTWEGIVSSQSLFSCILTQMKSVLQSQTELEFKQKNKSLNDIQFKAKKNTALTSSR